MDRKVCIAITFAFIHIGHPENTLLSHFAFIHIYIGHPDTGKVYIAITFAYTYIGHPWTGKSTLLSHLVCTNIGHPGTVIMFALLSHVLYLYILGHESLNCYYNLLYTYIVHPGTGKYTLLSQLVSTKLTLNTLGQESLHCHHICFTLDTLTQESDIDITFALHRH